MKRSEVSCASKEEKEQHSLLTLPVDLVIQIVSHFDEKSLFMVCMVSDTYKRFILSRVDLYTSIYALRDDPLLYSMHFSQIWGTPTSDKEEKTVCSHLNVCYEKKYRPRMNGGIVFSQRDTIFFNRIALRLRKLLHIERLFISKCAKDLVYIYGAGEPSETKLPKEDVEKVRNVFGYLIIRHNPYTHHIYDVNHTSLYEMIDDVRDAEYHARQSNMPVHTSLCHSRMLYHQHFRTGEHKIDTTRRIVADTLCYREWFDDLRPCIELLQATMRKFRVV